MARVRLSDRLTWSRKWPPLRGLRCIRYLGAISDAASLAATLISFEAAGDQAAAVALRLLSGERPEQVGTALGPEGSYLADVRQLQRWNLDESRLPAGTVVRFREPSIWVAYRWHIAAAALVIILQSLLIAALILQRRQRRIAEIEVQHQRTELAQASRLATLGELSASIAHEVNQPLGAISSNADAVELLLDAEPPKLEDARRVLLDLKRANQRASDVVIRIRGLLRKRELAFELYDLNAAAAEVVRLLDTDALARGVEVLTEFEIASCRSGRPIAVSAGVAEPAHERNGCHGRNAGGTVDI